MRSRSTNDSELIHRDRINLGNVKVRKGGLPPLFFLAHYNLSSERGQATLPDLKVTEVAMLSLTSFQPTSAPSPTCRSRRLSYQVADAQSAENAAHIRSCAGWMAGRGRKLPRSQSATRRPAPGRARIPGLYGRETTGSSRRFRRRLTPNRLYRC